MVILTAAICTFIGITDHASKAICFELSTDLRDLVRLTGLDPGALLWCRTLSRWWTIFCSIVLLLPALAYARVFGGIRGDDWVVAISWLVLIACLSAGFAMIATVSTAKGDEADATAGAAATILMLLYHFLFWFPAAIALLIPWSMHLKKGLPASSAAWGIASAITDWSPAVLFYRNLYGFQRFSLFAPAFWVHFLTALICVWLAMRVGRNRFRVTSQGDSDPMSRLRLKGESSRLTPFPRCGDRPLWWKDHYILGAGAANDQWFTFRIGCIAAFVVLMALLYRINLTIPIVALIASVCLVVSRFSALLAVEFQEKTFESLLILPISPWMIGRSKIEVVLWECRWLSLPLTAACGLMFFYRPLEIGVALIFTLLATVLLLEIVTLHHLAPETENAWPRLIGLILASIFGVAFLGQFPNVLGYVLPFGWLVLEIVVCLQNIDQLLNPGLESGSPKEFNSRKQQRQTRTEADRYKH